MFWADAIADEVERRYASLISSGQPIVIRDEKTASGQVHVGSLRSASMHAIVADVLKSRGHNVKFLFEINDFDPMDGIPNYLDTATYEQYMGVPLCNIPSPEPGFDNFAEYYGQEYVSVLKKIGFGAEVYRASELYRSGAMNEMIQKALERRAVVRDIYFRISKSEKPEDWYPLNVICENCGNLSATKITGFDGELVDYTCSSDTIAWAKGCGHSGRMSPYNGNAKFPWKLDWAAKFVAQNVNFEGGGKDHYTKGGSRQVAEAICREIFDHEPPYGVFNEFFLVGGKKMSSSKGNAASAREMTDILPPHILRLLLLKTPINRQLDFDPEGDAIPVLFDTYDKLAEKYWSGVRDDDSQVFNFIHLPDERAELPVRYLPRFSQVAFLVQMPHMDIYDEVAKMKETELTDIDVAELDERVVYAKRWLKEYADDKFIFTLQQNIPKATQSLTEVQQSALKLLSDKIELLETIDGQILHELIHEVKSESELSPKEFFGAIYTVFLGKDSGPKVGWFLSTLDKDFLIKRLRGEE
ncbi:MAG: lysine--tRNA ligase [Candidatus Pacebacteria bacterium]|nr:lysine--tRNA ligase [Candidatus Paceibacterota bacterium]MBP9842577.1 lysine--tRNA ligase [Candidatus Paceibacterota bacterium]